MANNIYSFLISFAVVAVSGFFVIPLLKKIKAGQPILSYVSEHKGKSGTPTFGGLFFIFPCLAVGLIFTGVSYTVVNMTVSITVAFAVLGFLDDFIKIKTRNNQGLKSYQKIVFQTAISIIIGVFVYKNGLTQIFIPFVNKSVDFGACIIPFSMLLFIALTNSVNLTDGLDGLASSVSIVYLAVFVVLMYFEISFFGIYDVNGIFVLCFCFMGGLLGFLVFNFNKAKVFMGDTGSLGLGGFLGCISVFSGNSLFVLFVGITFVFSSISVILQVIYFKRTGKRIFLMAPFHHHLQHKGLTEGKICFFYSLVTLLMGVGCLISFIV